MTWQMFYFIMILYKAIKSHPYQTGDSIDYT